MTSNDDDDYLTMTFDDSEIVRDRETLTQRKKRLAREAEERSRPKSKAQIVEEERAKRHAALSTNTLDKSSKGFKMMAALGYKAGSALGKEPSSNGVEAQDTRLREPIGVDTKEDRSGIGADSEKKRKFREEVERHQNDEKRQKIDAEEFRVRQQHEREIRHLEGQVWAAMKVAERLEEEDAQQAVPPRDLSRRSLRSVPVLWRGLVRDRLLKEQEKRRRYDMEQSLSRLPAYDDPDEDDDDKQAFGRRTLLEEVDIDLDQDDLELDEFEALEPAAKLKQLTEHLRTAHNYCFWCKYEYPDSEMEGCPGDTEEDHD